MNYVKEPYYILQTIVLQLFAMLFLIAASFLLFSGEWFLAIIIVFMPLSIVISHWKDWDEGKLRLISLLSPTLMWAYYNKKKRFFDFPIKSTRELELTRQKWTTALKFWNSTWLVGAALQIFAYSFFFKDEKLIYMQNLPLGFWTVVCIVLSSYVTISRIIEILVAFFYDAKDKLNNKLPSSFLTSYDRLLLMFKSYIELSINFALLFFIEHLIFPEPIFSFHCESGYIYDLYFYSIGVITTLGTGSMEAQHLAAKILTATEVMSGLVLLIFVLAIYIASNKERI